LVLDMANLSICDSCGCTRLCEQLPPGWLCASPGVTKRIRLRASAEGVWLCCRRSPGARGSCSGGRESWQSTCRRYAWVGPEKMGQKTENPGRDGACRGSMVRKARSPPIRDRWALLGGERCLDHVGEDFHSVVDYPRRAASVQASLAIAAIAKSAGFRCWRSGQLQVALARGGVYVEADAGDGRGGDAGVAKLAAGCSRTAMNEWPRCEGLTVPRWPSARGRADGRRS